MIFGKGFNANAALGDIGSLIVSARAGDIAAQRAGREWARTSRRQAMAEGEPTLAQGHALEAMFWARFAAGAGFKEDVYALVETLSELAVHWGFDANNPQAWYGTALLAEAVALLSRLADEGDDYAEAGLKAFAASLSPHILEQAKAYREAIDAGSK